MKKIEAEQDNKLEIKSKKKKIKEPVSLEVLKLYRTTVRSRDEKSELITRLNKMSGQLSGIANMVSDDRYTDDILIQLLSVYNTIKVVSNRLLKYHVENYVAKALKEGNTDVIPELMEMIKRIQ